MVHHIAKSPLGAFCGLHGLSPLLSPDAKDAEAEGHAADPDRHRDQTRMGIRIEQNTSGNPGRRKPKDHHDPDKATCRSLPFRCHPRGQKGQHVGPGGADAQTDQQKRRHRRRDTRPGNLFHQADGQRGPDRPGRQQRHPANDPGRAPTALVSPVTKPWPQELCAIVKRDEQTGQNGRHREFDHHDPVHCRRGQHHNRSKRQLNEP